MRKRDGRNCNIDGLCRRFKHAGHAWGKPEQKTSKRAKQRIADHFDSQASGGLIQGRIGAHLIHADGLVERATQARTSTSHVRLLGACAVSGRVSCSQVVTLGAYDGAVSDAPFALSPCLACSEGADAYSRAATMGGTSAASRPWGRSFSGAAERDR